MKSKIAIFGAVGVLAMALVAGIAFAQTEGEHGGMHHHMHGEMMGGPGMDFPIHELNLSEDQHGQIKQIMQAERPTIKPLMQQEMLAHQQLMQLITSGTFDQAAQAKASAIASQEAQTHAQLVVEHAKIGAQIYQLLNSDQKAKVADIMAKHQQRMQEHMQKEQQGASEQK